MLILKSPLVVFFKILFFLSLSNIVLSESIQAVTSIKIMPVFNIKAVNGKSYQSSLFGQKRDLKLNPGLNLIALEYEEVFEDNTQDNFDIIKSNVFLLEIYLKKNTQYQQRYIKPHNAAAAKKYALNPSFEITANNQSVKLKIHPLDNQSMTSIINKTSPIKKRIIDLSSNKKNKTTNAEKKLIYWWKKATPEEKANFLKLIKSK